MQTFSVLAIAASASALVASPGLVTPSARHVAPVMQFRERLLPQASSPTLRRSGVGNPRSYDQLVSYEGRAASRGNQRNAQDRAYLRGRPYGSSSYSRGYGIDRSFNRDRGYGIERGGRFGFGGGGYGRGGLDTYRGDRGFGFGGSRGYGFDRGYEYGGSPFSVNRFFDRGRDFFDDFRGREQMSEAILYYTISDVVLRVLAVYVFGHAAGGMVGWLGFWAYLTGQSYVARSSSYFGEGYESVVNTVGSSVSGLFPLVTDSNGKYSQTECLYSTLACIAFVLAGLYWPGLSHPKPDPTTAQSFKMSVSAILTIASATKFFSFARYVYPDTYGEDAPRLGEYGPYDY